MSPHERGVRVRVPIARPRDELLLGSWPAHHCCTYIRGLRPVPALPPGPRAPSAWQTVEWIARPTRLLERAAARYGEPFTLRTLWMDAPVVVVWEPEAVRSVLTADPAHLRAGASSSIIEPFAGPTSILVTDGPEHLRQRRLMLPPFHGERLRAWQGAIAAEAEAEVASWPAWQPLTALPRMRALTLRVIMAAVFGERDDALRDEIRRVLDMTHGLPRLISMAVVQRDLGPRGPWGSFRLAVARMDARIHDAIRHRRARPGGAILDSLLAATDGDGRPATDAEVRDQVVTLLAAGHETTAAALAFGLELLVRHPGVLARLRDADDAYLDAVVKEVLRVRPVLSLAPRKAHAPFEVAGWTVPAGVHVAACIHLAHRRPEVYPQPAAFRPQRWLTGELPSYSWIPFGGGVRRCLGAAFATLEMREVLRAVAQRWALTPVHPRPETIRRRAVTLTPARGGQVIPRPL